MDLELKSKCWKTKQIQFSLKSLTFPSCFWVVEKALKESSRFKGYLYMFSTSKLYYVGYRIKQYICFEIKGKMNNIVFVLQTFIDALI